MVFSSLHPPILLFLSLLVISACSASTGGTSLAKGTGHAFGPKSPSLSSRALSRPMSIKQVQSQTTPSAVQGCFVVGLIGMSVGAVCFFLLAFRKENEALFHHITFLTAAIAAVSYYAMWIGGGVSVHTDEVPVRFVFWARYVEWFFVLPLILVNLALLARATRGTLVSLVGACSLFVCCNYLGAIASHAQKYVWWAAGTLFYLIVLLQLFTQLRSVKDSEGASGAMILRHLTYLTALSWTMYPLAWLLGQEGMDVISLTVQGALLTCADLLAIVGFGVYLIMNREILQQHSMCHLVDVPASTGLSG